VKNPARTANLLAAAALAVLLHGVSLSAAAEQKAKDASAHYPRLTHADVPFYPPAAWSAHFGGTVEIEVTVEDGKVINAELKGGKMEGASSKVNPDNRGLLDYLSVPSLENVKTWRFVPEGRTAFVVTYTYRLQGTETSSPENPTVLLDLPHSITVSVRPFRPTTSNN